MKILAKMYHKIYTKKLLYLIIACNTTGTASKNKITMQKNPQCLLQIKQTFGVKTQLLLFNDIIKLVQLDINQKVFGNGFFISKKYLLSSKKPLTKFFVFKKEYNQNKEFIEICSDNKSNNLKVTNIATKNNEKSKIQYKTNNIYYLLPEILKIDLLMGSAPDYFKKENEIVLKHGEKNSNMYQLYYSAMGKYRVYNILTYLNEQVNLRMGQVLNIFDIPAFIIHSGDGKEIFVYLGIHICPKDKKVYYGALVLSFDILSICRDLFYYIETCPHCHGSIKENLQDGVIFKIQKTYKTS